ncbi:glycoside hydrolase family 43 protein [Prolixibacter denitrificans]|uniref:Alpha-N-arabinofuranosidase n=1 Tax=Prolixibacter denitrificans TaxID=1541063 RepID=A0A2P8CCQ4_9BACT|nr:glycoside hydrolase family 43 protein [Prolixibacter denitrificans]PSK82756.1 alpha-N-arabinofuranosidase [Prolixibacter denitrificans]GET21424.1 xylosidase/arabinosidase [Prolixibacter denitrificans]
MNKKTALSVFHVLYLLAFLSISGSSCQTQSKDGVPKFATDSLVAHFDYFTYKGDDDFYKDNPLPGDDYYYNPILPGWYSDPSICTNGNDYFLVTSNFSYYPGVPIFHSTDMLNWKQIGSILDTPSKLPLDGQRVSEGIFAPAISYNPNNKTYYMITTNIRRGNFFVKTKDPFGEWSEPVWLPDIHGIDPSFFFDDNGKAYIVNNDEPDGGSTYSGHRAIRIRQFDVATDKTFGPSIMLVNGGVNLAEKPIWIEGPHMYKINGKYYLMCAEGGTSVNHSEVIFNGNSPMGKFIPWPENPILTQRDLDPRRPLPITCAGHADLVQKDNGQWWSVFLACRPINDKFENLGRETFMMPVRWSIDGFPYITKGDEVIPRIIRMDGVKRDSTTTFGNFEKNDDFNSEKLGQEWMTLRGPAEDLYSLTANPGFLTLKCADVTSSELKTPAFVTRRLQHHQFESTTSVYFKPYSKSESAGLLLFKDEGHQYFLALGRLKDNSETISLRKIKRGGEVEILASHPLKLGEGATKLKVVSDGTHFNFYYAPAGSSWKLLASNIDAYYLSTANAHGFTGTTIGLYATNKFD